MHVLRLEHKRCESDCLISASVSACCTVLAICSHCNESLCTFNPPNLGIQLFVGGFGVCCYAYELLSVGFALVEMASQPVLNLVASLVGLWPCGYTSALS